MSKNPFAAKAPYPDPDRLLAIIRELSLRPGQSPDDLAKRLGWGKSTIRGDVRQLKDRGLLEASTHRDGYRLIGNQLTANEALWLLQCRRLVGEDLLLSLPGPAYEDLARRLYPYMAADQTDELPYPAIGAAARMRVDHLVESARERLSLLYTAIMAGQPLSIASRPSRFRPKGHARHTVHPLQLTYHDHAWYLLGALLDGQFHAYRVDHLDPRLSVPVEPAPLSRARKQSLLAEVQRRLDVSWGMFVPPDTETLVDVSLRFDKLQALEVQEWSRRPGIQRLPRRDGSVDYRFQVHQGAIPGVSRWVLRQGPGVMVLGGNDLLVRVRQGAADIMARYVGPDGSGDVHDG